MPTAARLTAAVCLALVAFVVSGMIKPLWPESTDFGYFTQVNMLIGLCAGWIVMGARVGRGITAAIHNGLAGVFVLLIWGLGVQAIHEMMRLAMRNRYDNVFEAVTAVAQIAAKFGAQILTLPVALALIMGGVISGLMAEYADKRWR
ncbi:TrgA family protein [Sulfitobacter aestuarii]|uniref:TrgA family protein n=1 Tax=Sulfitobacter aestuarii TaxID=2161676 RepID=A0ABW5U5N1_9RHOB